jgi:hypothetical protein
MMANLRFACLVLTMLVGVIAVLVVPFLVWRWRHRPAEERRLRARILLRVGLATLVWLDGVLVVHAFDLEGPGGVPWTLRVALGFALTFLALVPWCAGSWREVLGGPLLLLGLAAALLHAPWTGEKYGVLAVERTLGQPLEVVQQELRTFGVTVYPQSSDESLPLPPDTRVGNLDLVALEPGVLVLGVLGGCRMTVEDGRVESVFFNYD